MAKVSTDPKSLATLQAAEIWKARCLLADSSLFSDSPLWTAPNLRALRTAFVDHPIEGSQPFYEKLSLQLKNQPAQVQQLAAECLWALLVFVHEDAFRASERRRRIGDVWALSGRPLPESNLLSDEAMWGVGWPGTAFLTLIPVEFRFVIDSFLAWKLLEPSQQSALIADPWSFCDWLTSQEGGDRRIFRQMLLYLLFPDKFERVCSRKQRKKIYEVFSQRYAASGSLGAKPVTLCDLDRALLAIRGLAEAEFGTDVLDFYHDPLHPLWVPKPSQPTAPPAARKFWIEKTKTTGVPDRLEGEHRLGAALWSPQRSATGAQIYTNMPKVEPGDIVFHLTDNTAITGVSVAAGAVDDTFLGLENTPWAGRPGYRIELKDFTKLDPPLDRSSFLNTEPFSELLRALTGPGAGVFFNKKLELNEGAYLTAASDTLMAVLNAAYVHQAKKNLPFCDELPEPGSTVAMDNLAHDLSDLFLDEEEVDSIISLWGAKKNVILQGPPGVGKSFAARKLAHFLMEAADDRRVQFVQFHQSYAYEDFVEGFRPDGNGFSLHQGKFVRFCEEALADPEQKYVFIIDEINRGNLSKIFGELMLLIEPDKRDPSWSVELAYGGDKFYVPKNVYLLGLMNTADRSLAVVDYALRRRFAFIDLVPKIRSPKLRSKLVDLGVPEPAFDQMIARIEALNDVITKDMSNLGAGFAIGHSFFCSGPSADEDSTTWWSRIIKTEIMPLLREYWFDAPDTANDWQTKLLLAL